MGSAVLIPADRRPWFDLVCDECGKSERFAARFMGERVLQLGRARREGWGFREGRLVGHQVGAGRGLQRVARLCPTCAAIARHAREGGLWGHLLAELRAVRDTTLGPSKRDPGSRPKTEVPPRPAYVRPSGQLDLFGHAA